MVTSERAMLISEQTMRFNEDNCLELVVFWGHDVE